MRFRSLLAEAFGRRPAIDHGPEIRASTQRAVDASERLVQQLNEPLDGFFEDLRSAPPKRRGRKVAAR